MADIIEFCRKADHFRSEKEQEQRQRKVETLRKIFKCTRCAFRCAKCGASLEQEGSCCQTAAPVAPYPFCANCGEEYGQFKERLQDPDTSPLYYWQNEAWMEVWRSWLEHQQRLDEYRRSKEFLQLLGEVEHILSDE